VENLEWINPRSLNHVIELLLLELGIAKQANTIDTIWSLRIKIWLSTEHFRWRSL